MNYHQRAPAWLQDSLMIPLVIMCAISHLSSSCRPCGRHLQYSWPPLLVECVCDAWLTWASPSSSLNRSGNSSTTWVRWFLCSLVRWFLHVGHLCFPVLGAFRGWWAQLQWIRFQVHQPGLLSFHSFNRFIWYTSFSWCCPSWRTL